MSLDILFILKGLLGTSSQIYILAPPSFQLLSNLYGVAKPSIRNWSVGKLPSILLSVTTRISTLFWRFGILELRNRVTKPS